MPDSLLMTDVFTPDAFTVLTLTATLNNMPYKPGWLSALGLFSLAGFGQAIGFALRKQTTFMAVRTPPAT